MAKEGMPQPDETTRIVDGVTQYLRGGVWYKEKKVSKTSSTQSIGIGNVRARWTSGAEITAAHQRGRKGGFSKIKPNHP